MKKRIWRVDVEGGWLDSVSGRRKYQPVMFYDGDRALAFADMIKQFDRQDMAGRERRVKVKSWTGDFAEYERPYHPELM